MQCLQNSPSYYSDTSDGSWRSAIVSCAKVLLLINRGISFPKAKKHAQSLSSINYAFHFNRYEVRLIIINRYSLRIFCTPNLRHTQLILYCSTNDTHRRSLIPLATIALRKLPSAAQGWTIICGRICLHAISFRAMFYNLLWCSGGDGDKDLKSRIWGYDLG